jgi:hypothetical protein
MPASPQNNTDGAPLTDAETLRWKRQLEHERLVWAAAEKIKAEKEESGEPTTVVYYPPPPVNGGQDIPDRWKRRLEHGRLSAVALEQSWLLPGPGAAGRGGGDEDDQQQAMQMMMMAQAQAAEADKKKEKKPLGDITKKLVKAQLIKKLKETSLSLCRNWIACWIFLPVTFALYIHYNGELKKTADMYKEESRKRQGPLPGEDQKLKQYLKNLTLYKMVEWMNWAIFFCFWYGLLMLVVILIYAIYVLIKCAITVGIAC